MTTTKLGAQPGKQSAFLSSSADITIYGGARGGGKSYGLLLEPMRHVKNAGFRAVFFRKTTQDLTKAGGLWDTSHQLYGHVGGRPRMQPNLDWTFPSGAQFKFNHLERASDVEDHRGAQYAYIGIDELPQFSEEQFWFLMSCNRSTCGVRPYVRATCNPQPGWVKDLIAWWLDDDGRFAREDRAGVVRHFVRGEDGVLRWADDPEDLRAVVPEQFVDKDGNHLATRSVAMSLTFIPAKLEDNVALTSADPMYRAKLANMQLVDKKRFLEGDWAIRESAGNMFRSQWFPIVDVVRPYIRIIRYWDLAGSKRRRSDFTAGAKFADHGDGTFTIVDIRNEKLTPKGVEDLLSGTAHEDGVEVEVHLEQETGASGELLIDQYARGCLKGFVVEGHSVRNQGTKVDRAKPLSSAAEHGYVSLLRAPWNRVLLDQAEQFPEGDHDDMVDAASGAHSAIQDGGFAFASGSMGGRR